MTVSFAFPDRTLETAIIFVDGVEYDRVPTDSLEYYIDSDDLTEADISIKYTNGITTTDAIAVKTFEQKLITAVNQKITKDVIDVAQILDSLDMARREVIIDLCKYYYGDEIIWIKDNYYRLPNRIFFDFYGGGEISTYDVEFYKQQIPIYEFTEKESVNVIAMNVKDRWVQLDAKLPGTSVLKANFYGLQRELKTIDLIDLIAMRIVYNYYQDSYNNIVASTETSAGKIKVGDIVIENPTGNSSSSLSYFTDRLSKVNAQYTDKINKFKRGFYRIK